MAHETTDDVLLELARLYRKAEARIKRDQLGELFQPPAATGKESESEYDRQSSRSID